MTSPGDIDQTRRIVLWVFAAQVTVLVILFAGAPARVPAYLGFVDQPPVPLMAWLLAAVTVVAYTASAATISTVREYLFRLDGLKVLCIFAAIAAGIVEEVVFRKLLMDFLAAEGVGDVAQIIASGLAFGVAHIVWGFKSWSAAVNAMLSTALLGAALAVVYIVADRNLAPCVVAHVVITALIEPGLIIAGVRDRLGYWRERES